MRTTLIVILSFISINFYGQCIECNSFEDAFIQPDKVKSIKINSYFHKIELDSMPREIDKFVNIEILYLTDHNIEYIPKEIGELKKLREISFSGCSLKEVPDEILSLTNLKEVILLNTDLSQKYKKELKKKFKEDLPNTLLLIN